MLNAIIYFSIRNKVVIGLFTLALIGWGIWSATQLPIDAVPDITNNQVQVITSSPSLAAEDIERLVTFPIEVSLSNIPGLTEIRSFSRFGLSIVTVVFTDATDVYWARQQISERLQNVTGQIPPGVGTPTMAPVTTGLGEIFQYTVVPKKGFETRYTLTDLRTIQDWTIRRALLGTPGVADVSGFGGKLKQYEIAVDPDRLRSVGVTMTEIFSALQQNNQNTGGAYIDKQPNAFFIRSDGLIHSPDDIADIVIHLNTNNLPIRVRDVAQVRIGEAVRYGAVTRNGQDETVGAVVMMVKGENSSAVIKRVKEKIAQIQQTLPPGVQIIPFLDRTKMVNSAIGTVERNLLEGATIVIVVLVLLLGNFRAGFVVASVIPLALLFAIAMMNLFGVSGNLMSLGAIDFGLIVDGAVIIVEATLHHITLRNLNRTLTQDEMDEEVFQSAGRIRSSAAFGELIILIVYLPILALSGIEGKMFRPMALTVAFAILGAFILSITYVPMVSALLLDKKIEHKNTLSDRLMKRIQRFYEPILLRSLKHRLLILSSAVALLVVAGLLFSRMGGEFIPQLDEGDFAVDTRTLTGSSLSETVDATLKAEQILLKQFPEVEQVVAKIGSGEIPTDPMAIEAADQMVILKPKDQWTSARTRDELAGKMAEALSVIPGVTFGFQQPVQMRFNELMTGARQDVALKIYGDDLGQLAKLADEVGNLTRTIKGAKDLYIEQVGGLSQILIKLDRAQIAKYGLNVTDVNRVINTAFAGQSAGLVFEGEKRFDLVVRLAADKRQSIDDIQNVYVTVPARVNAMEQQIPLSQIAQVSMELAPNQIQRDNTHRRITLGFNVRGRDVESIVTELQQKVSQKLKFPPGYSITYGGQFQNLLDAKKRLSIAVPVALALIFSLLFFTFGSVRQSLLIFMAIPMAAIGGVFSLLLRGMPFSISAGVGFIALFGVAVLNGIVLIAEFNRLRHEEGLTDLTEIIRQGAEVRLRPVIMTALVASFGFIPMAISNSAGAEVQKPLATVVIGGLFTATLLTLIVLPILYSLSERKAVAKEAQLASRSKTKSASAASISILVLVVSLLSACQSDENGNSDKGADAKPDSTKTAADSASNGSIEVSLTQAQYNVAAIELGTPVDRTMSTTFKVNGTVDVPAQNRVSVSVPFGGYIREINLEPGMQVRKGQSLVVLENPDYIQLQQDYLDTKAKLEFADLEFARQQELSRENVSALKVFQQTRSSRQSLQAQLAGLAQRLAILRINPATLSPERLTRTVVIPSPVSGFITNVPVNKGRFINPADVVAEIVSLDHLHVQLRVFEKDISRIRTGQSLRFGMGGDASLTHRATIFLIGKSISEDRTISVMAHPEAYSPDLIPGGYVAAQIQVRTQPMAALPESAIVSYVGKSLIYVLTKKQTSPATYQFRQIEVKTGIRENGYVAVTLPPDINPAVTPVVVKGAYSLLAKLNNSEEE
ncbi:CusA/CzcA family heavy metal efflux RND transporter [Spirosoma harenae]